MRATGFLSKVVPDVAFSMVNETGPIRKKVTIIVRGAVGGASDLGSFFFGEFLSNKDVVVHRMKLWGK